MDSRLLGYYERELRYLREMGTEFARDFPNIAGRLSLEQFTCADPYVERLLEGFAFLSARVQLKLDAEFPRFVQNLLQTASVVLRLTQVLMESVLQFRIGGCFRHLGKRLDDLVLRVVKVFELQNEKFTQ